MLAEEVAEEKKAQAQTQTQRPRRSTRSSGVGVGLSMKGFADRVGESLHGKSSGVLGVDSRR